MTGKRVNFSLVSLSASRHGLLTAALEGISRPLPFTDKETETKKKATGPAPQPRAEVPGFKFRSASLQ